MTHQNILNQKTTKTQRNKNPKKNENPMIEGFRVNKKQFVHSFKL